MKDYERLTSYMQVGDKVVAIQPQRKEHVQAYIDRLFELRDKIEIGELCEREAVRKETAREILSLLGKGFDEHAMKDFKDLPWYKQFCREIKLRYGVDLEEQK